MRRTFRVSQVEQKQRRIRECQSDMKYLEDMIRGLEKEVLQLNKEIEEIQMEGGKLC